MKIDTTTKAWKVTEENTKVLANMTGRPEQTFKANLGWYLVEDWSYNPRFHLMPPRIFERNYPKILPSVLKVDEVVQ